MERQLRWVGMIVAALLLPVSGGCNVLGYALSTVGGPGDVAARYTGLANQRVGVMTWAERSVKYYYSYMGSDVQSDISTAVTERLRSAANPKGGAEELGNVSLVEAKLIYKWQRNHPEMDNRLATEVAPELAAALPMTRLIHVELQEFATRDPNTEFLLRGHAVLNVRVVEIDPATKASRVGYEEVGITATFPAKAPEGVPPTATFTEDHVRRGLINEVATAVAVRFFKHPSQE
jgi:hypothetical protein